MTASTEFLQSKDSEIVIGLVSAVGTDHDRLVEYFSRILEDQYRYRVTLVRITKLIRELKDKKPNLVDTPLLEEPEYERLKSYMDAGSKLRASTQRGDFLALSAAAMIHSQRLEATKGKARKERHAYVIRSIKHQDEVRTLRSIYGSGFYLVGIFASLERRLKRLVEVSGIKEELARKLIKRDTEEEGAKLGQQTRKAFELSDFFVEELDDPDQTRRQIERAIDLIFNHPYITPTQEEHSMFLAYASSLRSADLSRQVGAVILSKEGEVIATGANDVPKAGGGQYWPDERDRRDYKIGYDSNQKIREELASEVIAQINEELKSNLSSSEFKAKISEVVKEKKARAKLDALIKNFSDLLSLEKKKNSKNESLLDNSRILDITEYGRPVHAEMEALDACNRIGVSAKGGRLFVTTFPCHGCAKHIVDSGIKEVTYIEPYPKSRAEELHSDSIHFVTSADSNSECLDGVVFKPFVGVGPRRFFDLFSMNLSSGTPKKRKEKGKVISWQPANAQTRIQLQPISYLDREAMAIVEFNKHLGGTNEQSKKNV